ncbi:MAG: bifunctional phosphoribosylaminoimidazolecarboxamide formyltransferase/IMP cyclohydrolase, partial [Pseudomonadota bacterium]
MADKYPARRALISVSDKTGLVELAEGLAGHGIALLSTGGTAGLLRDAGLAVTEVSDVTGFPEIMDGRVKTLHPKVHGALLAVRDDPAHREAMDTHGIEGIDILIANLYPFEATIAEGAEYGEAVEQIDIGGPAMIRAAAKNHAYVSVVVDPEDYGALLVELEEGQGATGYAFRQRLALTAYGRTAAYDAAVSSWMTETLTERAPRRMSFAGIRAQELRYGENPHQAAGFYRGGPQRAGISTAQQWQGKDLSYNNINDTDAAFELVAEFPAEDGPACAIIKHANPCGVATGTTLQEAYARAFDCDRISAFGGIVALNQTLDAETARAITEILTEVVIAPDADSAAKDVFAAKRNLRLLTTGCLPDPAQPGLAVKQVAGGFLLQDRDNGRIAASDLKVVTKRAPDD